jgi:hypothetical protein
MVNRSAERRSSYVESAIRGEVDRVLDAPVGGRNTALNRAAWNLGRLIAAGLVPRSVVEDALCSAGQAAGGQSAAGVAATVRSAINTRLTVDDPPDGLRTVGRRTVRHRPTSSGGSSDARNHR